MGTQRRIGKCAGLALMAAVVGVGGFRFSIFDFRVFGGRGAFGAVVGTGDVVPANPATWTSTTVGYVGNISAGTITVSAGSTLNSREVFLGNNASSSGLVTIDG